MFRLVLADIDGTLYGFDRIFTEETRQALNDLHKKGYLVGLASGRAVSFMKSYSKDWGLDFEFDAYVGMNGALVYDTLKDKQINGPTLTKQEVLDVFENMAPLNLNGELYCTDDVSYIMHMDEEIERSIKLGRGLKNFVVLNDDLSVLDKVDTYRIMFRVPGEMEKVEEYVACHPFHGAEGFRTQKWCYEVMKKGVNKGLGVKLYCEENNIPLDEVITFGDTTNDVAMLECTYGVCLCDGTQDAIDAANDVTEFGAAENGFAHYVRKHLLNE